jgi:hypothetical protein
MKPKDRVRRATAGELYEINGSAERNPADNAKSAPRCAYLFALPNVIPRMTDHAAAGRQSLWRIDAGGTNHRVTSLAIAER